MTRDTTKSSESDESTSTSEEMGTVLGALTSYLFAGPKAFAVGFWKRMIGGKSLGESLIVMGYQMRLRSSGDAIVNVIYEDGVVKPRSATYESGETVFETDNGERFSARGIGYNPRRVGGKVPVVWAMRIGSEVTEPLEAAFARSRRLGAFEEVERQDGTQDVAVDLDPERVHDPSGAAVADGGMAGLDGMVVSFREGYELFGSKVTNEDMENQETRGKLAALDFAESDTWKIILAVLAAAALGLFGPSLASQLASGAASGVGGGIGLFLGGGFL